MTLKATCPTDPSHKTFVTVAHVTEDWIVDEHGNFLDLAPSDGGETLVPPQKGNTWTCTVCWAEAKVE